MTRATRVPLWCASAWRRVSAVTACDTGHVRRPRRLADGRRRCPGFGRLSRGRTTASPTADALRSGEHALASALTTAPGVVLASGTRVAPATDGCDLFTHS